MKESKKFLSFERLVNFINECFVNQNTNKKLAKIACCFAFGFLSFFGLFSSTQNNLFAQTSALEYREENDHFPAGYYDKQGVRYELNGDQAIVAAGQKVPIRIINRAASWDVVLPDKVSVVINGVPTEYLLTGIAAQAFDGYCYDDLWEFLGSVDARDCTALTFIGKRAFYHCLCLKSALLPVSLEVIGVEAFAREDGSYADISLELNINECVNLSTMEDKAFYRSNLKSIDLSKCVKLEYIGNEVFGFCCELIKVVLPSELPAIGDKIFKDCIKLRVICFIGSEFDQDDWAKLLGLEEWNAASCKMATFRNRPGKIFMRQLFVPGNNGVAIDPAEFGMEKTIWSTHDGKVFDFGEVVTRNMVLYAQE